MALPLQGQYALKCEAECWKAGMFWRCILPPHTSSHKDHSSVLAEQRFSVLMEAETSLWRVPWAILNIQAEPARRGQAPESTLQCEPDQGLRQTDSWLC